jgi:hypothetical protein
MAETLNMENDEIIFVDWNTSDAIPTLIEDISDTLTSKCLSLLKVIRVSEKNHSDLAPSELKRPTIEPYARNIAIRHANSKNHWLLSTNTDMIFITQNGFSLSETIQSLPDGYYQSYRFEIPEFIWSTFNRIEPKKCIEDSKKWFCETFLGKKINLNIEGIKAADAPGDFQLAPLKNWNEIKGFPESLVFGWGVDGAVIKDLTDSSGDALYIPESKLISMHCNHLRALTHFHNPSLPSNPEFSQPQKNSDAWGVIDKKFSIIDPRDKVARADVFLNLVSSNYENNAAQEIDLSVIHETISYPLFPTLHFIFDYLDLNFTNKNLIYVGFSPAMIRALNLVSNEFGIRLEIPRLDVIDFSESFWESIFNGNQNSLLVLDLGHEENEILDSYQLEYLSNLALSIPSLAEFFRKNGIKNQVAFVRAVAWAVRELVVSEFETPLFNNYGMVLTGRPRTVSLLKSSGSKLIKASISTGVRSLYRVQSPHNSPGRFALIYGLLRRFLPKRLKRLIHKVIYRMAGR